MNIYCPEGLHHGVFQGLDRQYCSHTFYVNNWNSEEKLQPNNVVIMSKEMLENPDDDFFDAIIVQSYEGYYKVMKFAKTILLYHLMNGRGWNNHMAGVYANPYVVPMFISTSCRTSHGFFEGIHKTIYPGIDEEYWNGWVGDEKKIIHVRNEFENRDKPKYTDFLNICNGNPYTLIGRGGNIQCGYQGLREQFRKHRVFVNVEIFTSTFSISSMEAMMTGVPIICNDIEGTGEGLRDGIEGFISNNIGYLKNKTRDLLNDHDMAKELGKNAREMAKIKFGKKQFNFAWNNLLDNLDYYRRV